MTSHMPTAQLTTGPTLQQHTLGLMKVSAIRRKAVAFEAMTPCNCRGAAGVTMTVILAPGLVKGNGAEMCNGPAFSQFQANTGVLG